MTMSKLAELQQRRLTLIKTIQGRREEIRKRCQDVGIKVSGLDREEKKETEPYKKELEQVTIEIEDELTNREEYRKSWKSKLIWISLSAVVSVFLTLLVSSLYAPK